MELDLFLEMTSIWYHSGPVFGVLVDNRNNCTSWMSCFDDFVEIGDIGTW